MHESKYVMTQLRDWLSFTGWGMNDYSFIIFTVLLSNYRMKKKNQLFQHSSNIKDMLPTLIEKNDHIVLCNFACNETKVCDLIPSIVCHERQFIYFIDYITENAKLIVQLKWFSILNT